MLCGIARPDSFKQTLNKLNCQIVSEYIASDHHWFDQSDNAKIEALVSQNDIDFIVTTEKDLVRLNLSEDLSRRTFAITLATEWLGNAPQLPDLDGNL